MNDNKLLKEILQQEIKFTKQLINNYELELKNAKYFRRNVYPYILDKIRRKGQSFQRSDKARMIKYFEKNKQLIQRQKYLDHLENTRIPKLYEYIELIETEQLGEVPLCYRKCETRYTKDF